MRNFFKKTTALLAALTVMTMCPLSVGADTLTTEDGVKYINYDDGEKKPYTGWTKKAGKRFYYKNGIMKKNCLLTSKGRTTYYLTPDGSAAVGKVTVSGIEYNFDDNGKIIPDEWGISLTAKNASSEKLTVIFSYDGTETGGRLEYGEHFTLEYYDNSEWKPVLYKKGCEDPMFFDEAYDVIDKREEDYYLSGLYDELPSGYYRFCTSISNCRKPGDYDDKMYYAYFTI